MGKYEEIHKQQTVVL